MDKRPTQLQKVKRWIAESPGITGAGGVRYTHSFGLRHLAVDLGISETAASARLRDLRKLGHDVSTVTTRVDGATHVLYVVSVQPVREVDSTAALAKRDAKRSAVRRQVMEVLRNAPYWAGNYAKAIDIARALVP